jgi:hypothetical protein
MAKSTGAYRIPQYDSSEAITIERREIVATIVPSENGSRSMLAEAFEVAANLVERNGEPMRLEWHYGGLQYVVEATGLDPNESNV